MATIGLLSCSAEQQHLQEGRVLSITGIANRLSTAVPAKRKPSVKDGGGGCNGIHDAWCKTQTQVPDNLR
jgi:hypothetical protein